MSISTKVAFSSRSLLKLPLITGFVRCLEKPFVSRPWKHWESKYGWFLVLKRFEFHMGKVSPTWKWHLSCQHILSEICSSKMYSKHLCQQYVNICENWSWLRKLYCYWTIAPLTHLLLNCQHVTARFNAGPPSTTLAQHQISTGSLHDDRRRR